MHVCAHTSYWLFPQRMHPGAHPETYRVPVGSTPQMVSYIISLKSWGGGSVSLWDSVFSSLSGDTIFTVSISSGAIWSHAAAAR